MTHPTGPLRCPAWFPPRGGISWDRKDKKRSEFSGPEGAERSMFWGWGVAASSRGAPPPGTQTVRTPNPLSSPRSLRAYRGAWGRGTPERSRRRRPDTSRHGREVLARAYPSCLDRPGTGHSQSEGVEKPTQGASHLRWTCESHSGLWGRAQTRLAPPQPPPPPILSSVRFARSHRACGNTSQHASANRIEASLPH